MSGLEWGVNADPNPEPGAFLVEWRRDDSKGAWHTYACLAMAEYLAITDQGPLTDAPRLEGWRKEEAG